MTRLPASSTAWTAFSSPEASAHVAGRARSSPATSPASCDPLSRHLSRHARRRLGVRAARLRHGGCELDRDGSGDAVPGDRPPAGAEGDRGPRRHDAPRGARGRARRGDARRAPRTAGRGPRAPPPPLRGQQPVPRAACRCGARRLGHVPGRAAGRDRRAARPPVFRGAASSTPSSSRGPHGAAPLFRGFVDAALERSRSRSLSPVEAAAPAHTVYGVALARWSIASA